MRLRKLPKLSEWVVSNQLTEGEMERVLEAQSTYFPRDETGLVCLPTQLERTLQLYWGW